MLAADARPASAAGSNGIFDYNENIFNLVRDSENKGSKVTIVEECIEQESNEIKRRKGPEFDVESEEGIIIEDIDEERRRDLSQKVLNFLWKVILELPDAKVGNVQLVNKVRSLFRFVEI